MKTSPTIWFPAKTVGYGWGMPTCWQGRVVLAVYIALLIVGAFAIFSKPSDARYYFLYALVITLILIFVTWLKGEKLDQPEKK
jgi:hypothetical protein